jgi:hypothetical protein
MFRHFSVNAHLAALCFTMALLIALIVIGMVPYVVLASHFTAVVAAALIVGAVEVIAVLFAFDRYGIPALERFLEWMESRRHCECCIERQPTTAPVKRFQIRRAGWATRIVDR